MQPERLLLPELNRRGHHAKAGPVRRPAHRADAKTQGGRRAIALQLEATGQGPRLVRSPGAELAESRPGGEIRVGLGGRHRLRGTRHADLPLDLGPVEAKSGMRIGRKLGGLGTVEIGVEDKTARIDALEEEDAHVGQPGRIGGRHRHGRRIGHPTLLGGGKPLAEPGDGVGWR